MDRYYHNEYKQKQVSAKKAASLVNSGDWVSYGYCLSQPVAVDIELAQRKEELSDVTITGALFLREPETIKNDTTGKHFRYQAGHCSVIERALVDRGVGVYRPAMFGQEPDWYRRGYTRCDILVIQVAPMDNYGFFNFGPNTSNLKAQAEVAKTVIVEVNPNIPRVLGGRDEVLHLSEVNYIVEDERAAVSLPELDQGNKPTERDWKIGEYIAEEIPDGACLQFGIGGIPNAICYLLTNSDVKNLGVHIEMLCDGIQGLFQAGKVTGKRKNIDREKIVATFALGTKPLYAWTDNNPLFAFYPVDYTNNPFVIAQNDNLISINSTLEVDLTGQVCSESIGTRHISGAGGQLEFALGAYLSRGGKSFLCLYSTYELPDGKVVSRIKPTLTPGAVVTVPRPVVHYLVTEYGKTILKGKNVWQRAEAIIDLAHPDFREDLIKEAEKLGIWRQSNKKTE